MVLKAGGASPALGVCFGAVANSPLFDFDLVGSARAAEGVGPYGADQRRGGMIYECRLSANPQLVIPALQQT